MKPGIQKRLRMFAGPNGSGKSSLIRKFSKDFAADGLFQLHHYLNADDFFRDLQDGKGIPLHFQDEAGTAFSRDSAWRWFTSI